MTYYIGRNIKADVGAIVHVDDGWCWGDNPPTPAGLYRVTEVEGKPPHDVDYWGEAVTEEDFASWKAARAAALAAYEAKVALEAAAYERRKATADWSLDGWRR